MGRSVSKTIGGDVGNALGFVVDPFGIENSNYERNQINKATQRAAEEQNQLQEQLIADQRQQTQDAERQQALANERLIEENAYAGQTAEGISTILTGGGGLSEDPLLQNRGRRTLLGTFDYAS